MLNQIKIYLTKIYTFVSTQPWYVWLIIGLIAFLFFTLRYIYRQKKLLKKRFEDNKSWQVSVNQLEQSKFTVNKQLSSSEQRLQELNNKKQEYVQRLEEAQKDSGLEIILDSLSFIDWLRKREHAERIEADKESLEANQKPFWQDVNTLKKDLMSSNEEIRFKPGYSEDFSQLLLSARDYKRQLEKDREELARQEKGLHGLIEEIRTIEQEISQLGNNHEEIREKLKDQIQQSFCPINIDYALFEKKGIENLTSFIFALKDAKKTNSLYNKTRSDLKEAQKTLNIEKSENVEITVKTMLTTSQSQLKDMNIRHKAAIENRTTAENKWRNITGDAHLALLEQEKETLALEMQQCIIDYSNKVFAERLARQALTIYRDNHRSTMMEKTEQAFKTLTKGNYQKLAIEQNDEKAVLKAYDINNHIKTADALSKGTRFQLYMALRAAAYEQLLEKGINMPFFCDDVFETFDEERTKAACELMQYIGQKGQAIYLTHHRHVIDIARDVCGDNVKIHKMH